MFVSMVQGALPLMQVFDLLSPVGEKPCSQAPIRFLPDTPLPLGWTDVSEQCLTIGSTSCYKKPSHRGEGGFRIFGENRMRWTLTVLLSLVDDTSSVTPSSSVRQLSRLPAWSATN